jgi:GDP-L-fucose synthase
MYAEAFAGAPADVVIHVAGTVGGIGATSTRPGEFFYDNGVMTLHVIEGFRKAGLIEHGSTLAMVGTAAAYPEHAPMPLREESLWCGPPSGAGASYGLAKLMGLEMLGAYRQQYGMRSAYLVPINVYGPGDHFEEDRSHVAAALVRRFVEATERGDREVVCWGTGRATRDFLYFDDAAEGIVLAAERMEEPTPLNLGTGRETSIRELADTIARLAGFAGEVRWDPSRPDGAARRVLDIRKTRTILGWEPSTALDQGLRLTIEWFRAHVERSGTFP